MKIKKYDKKQHSNTRKHIMYSTITYKNEKTTTNQHKKTTQK